MKTVTFASDSKTKLDLLIKVAKEMGIKAYRHYDLTDEEMALPGSKVTEKQLEEWLAKEDGESYDIEKAFNYMKKELGKSKKKK